MGWRSPKVLIPIGLALALGIAAIVTFGGTKQSLTRATRTPTAAAPDTPTPTLVAPTVAVPTDSAATVAAINATSPVNVGSVSAPIPTTPPFQNVEFPTQAVAYPADWPGDLRYPSQFTAVEVNTGALPDGTTQSWIAKLRFSGNTTTAAQLLTAFYTAKGWQVSQRDLGGGALLLTLDKESKKSSGFLVIDADAANPAATQVLATIRL